MAARARQLCFPCGCIGDTQYFDRGVVSVLQQPPSVMKRRQLLPASPYGARAGDAVTLASRLQTTLHCLRRTMGRKKKIFQFDSLPGALSVGSILTKGGGFLHGGGGGVKF